MEYTVAIGLVITAFVMMLFFNIYFRVKVFKYYKVLVQNRVQIEIKDLLNIQKIKSEVVPRYPKFEKEILAFVNNIRNSVYIAMGLIVVIALCWSILHKYK
ncbi:MAG TPA: hypothetical protein PKD85_10100 [Saprospiraceae bacterium]|nr:hypothetical protein [Saprospiraceae bacterium]